MSQFFETIAILNGKPRNIAYHNRRLNSTVQAYHETSELVDLEAALQTPKHVQSGLWKCKVIFDQSIRNIIYEPYTLRQFNRFKLIVADDLEYQHKEVDRQFLNSLYDQRGDCNDIIIVKNGLLTDTSIANIAFYDGKVWLTPRHPLLSGTVRQRLLENSFLHKADITSSMIDSFKDFAIMNAMMEFLPIPNVLISQ